MRLGCNKWKGQETIQAALRQLTNQVAQVEADIRTTEQQLSRFQEEKQDLLESIRQGGSVASKAAERLDQVSEEKKFISSHLSSLQHKLYDLQDQNIDAEDLITAIAQFDPVWDVLLPRERTRIVCLLIKQVDYDGMEGTLGITFQPSGIKTLAAEATGSEEEAE